MQWSAIQWGQLLSLLIMAFALGLDAFSLGLGMGMRGLSRWEILKISGWIGLFHMVMPLMGLIAGRTLNSFVGNVAAWLGGGLLFLLGVHMIWSSFVKREEKVFNHTTNLGLILFSLSVSMDALSVGFSLGLFKTDILITVFVFGVMGFLMSCTGLVLGRFIGDWAGEYGEAFGGMILVAFGLKIFF